MKTISDPVSYAKNAANAYASFYGADLVSVILYGSAAGGNYDPKRSDINLLIVLTSMSAGLIAKSASLQSKFARMRFDRPFFMDASYIVRSCDSYPMEFLDMKQSYTVLYGEDVLTSIVVQPEHLRLQVERELKGKWLHLLHEFSTASADRRRFQLLIQQSLRAFLPVFRALVHLEGKPVPESTSDLLREIEAMTPLQNQPLQQIADISAGKAIADPQAHLIAYADAIKSIVERIDSK